MSTRRRIKLVKCKSKFLQISDAIDWGKIRVDLEGMYDNTSERGGRPKCDPVMMFKILILQQWYGLSDMEAERQIADRISFMEFLGYPSEIPDSRTIWLFRERLSKTGMDRIVWSELQSQLDSMGLRVVTGTAQDATFIEADPGSSKKAQGFSRPRAILKSSSWEIDTEIYLIGGYDKWLSPYPQNLARSQK